nr:hypothetical protein Iba_chr07cCG14670 [Ipomoea batatas]
MMVEETVKVIDGEIRQAYLENPSNRIFSRGGVERLRLQPIGVVDPGDEILLVLDQASDGFIELRRRRKRFIFRIGAFRQVLTVSGDYDVGILTTE